MAPPIRWHGKEMFSGISGRVEKILSAASEVVSWAVLLEPLALGKGLVDGANGAE